MSIDVTDGAVRGVEAILENWKQFSRCHDDMHLRLQRLEVWSGDSVVATMKMDITMTENTLRHAYPHLMVDEDGSTRLASRLLNQRLVVNGSIRCDESLSKHIANIFKTAEDSK
ncbi:bZIP transcription factor 1 [Phytophthora cinnamomi]|uniref:bZIP transcription factor 1 n=1 Tax=Phytophthora cinnamomi TaxID=4785 RepID=UPI0035596257|nr:bZIP transcription factor 1 [Phytophthora cinnamomi]